MGVEIIEKEDQQKQTNGEWQAQKRREEIDYQLEQKRLRQEAYNSFVSETIGFMG